MKYFNCLVLIVLLSSFGHKILAQRYSFDIFILGKKVGEINTERTVESVGMEIFKMITDINTKPLWINKWSKTLVDAVFENKVLQSCSYFGETESTKLTVKSHKENTQYIVQKDAVKSSLKYNAISCSTVSLFYHEPVGVTQVYSERLGMMVPLNQHRPSEYTFVVPDGSVNIYKYVNGKLNEIELKKPIGTATIKLVKR